MSRKTYRLKVALVEKLLLQRGLNQVQLAKAIGGSTSRVSEWLDGDPISSRYLANMAKYFGVPIDELYQDTADEAASAESLTINSTELPPQSEIVPGGVVTSAAGEAVVEVVAVDLAEAALPIEVVSGWGGDRSVEFHDWCGVDAQPRLLSGSALGEPGGTASDSLGGNRRRGGNMATFAFTPMRGLLTMAGLALLAVVAGVSLSEAPEDGAPANVVGKVLTLLNTGTVTQHLGVVKRGSDNALRMGIDVMGRGAMQFTNARVASNGLKKTRDGWTGEVVFKVDAEAHTKGESWLRVGPMTTDTLVDAWNEKRTVPLAITISAHGNAAQVRCTAVLQDNGDAERFVREKLIDQRLVELICDELSTLGLVASR